MGSRGSNGGVGVPAGSRKIVQSLKEIVNCPEPEIYAMLKECNMDPNEAVNRLLSQDTFHEVKSKREKRKENKDTTESRPRGASSNSGRSSRGGADRYVGRGSESTKPTPGYRKENGSNASNVTSTPGFTGSNISRRATTISEVANGSKKPAAAVDGVSAVSQPSSGYQCTWGGVPGQVSMADIVKMGRPQIKVPSVSHHNVNSNQNHIQGIPSGSLHQNAHFSDDNTSEVHREPGDYHPVQHVSTDEEWPLIEQPSVASHPPVSEPLAADSELHPDAGANMSYDRINHQTEMDEVQGTDANTVDNIDSHPSIMLQQEDNAGGASLHENDLYRFQNPNHTFDHQQVEDVNVSVSSVAANLQHLNVQDDRCLPPEGDSPSVVIPDHLQVQTADCSHLSFGSFGSGIGGPFSGPLASAPVKTSFEDARKDVDGSSVGRLASRASEYYNDESLTNASESNLYHRTNATSANFDSPSASQPESLAEINEHGDQYSYPPSAAGYTYESAQQLSAAFSQPQTNPQMQNLAPFSNVMAFTNSLPSTLLLANAHAGREADLSYSQFSTTQAMAAKYGNSVSSIGGSTISVPESLKTVGFPSAQPTQQTHSGASVTSGPAVPQHLAVHPYSQPTLPLGPFANMISYPFMPQSYTYMPSAFQQQFAGNSNYHQTLAAMLPQQYKNSVSVSSLPQSASIVSGYGGFGNTTNIPGNFPMNPHAAPSGTNLGYDDVLSSQYKDTNHLMALQQSENSAMWLHGPGSRTMSAVPANTYYGFQGQNQQSGGFRQAAQQPLQNHGSLGYPNFYHSQTGISLEHQQQNPRDGSLGGSQGQSKQSQQQQLWQNSY